MRVSLNLAALSALLVLLASLTLVSCAEDDGLSTAASALAADETACYEACLDRGGDGEACREACSGEDGGAACFRHCIDAGGDELSCRERCAEDRSEMPSAFNRCYRVCLDEGGDATSCREACSDLVFEAPEPCADGAEVERDGMTFVCQDGEWVLQTL